MTNKKKIILAFSGGLDTSYCIPLLKERGFEVHAITINTGGVESKEVIGLQDKAIHLGADYFDIIDATTRYYDKVIKYLIYGNVLKNGSYPLSVSAERVIQALEIVHFARENNVEYIAHGSTGAGNDQVRFDLIFQVLYPQVNIVTPIRDSKISREEQIQYLKKKGIALEWEKAKYSINKGLWGTSVGGSETLTSKAPLPEEAYPNPLVNKDTQNIKLTFKQGEITKMDDVADSPTELINKLNSIAQKYAIGRNIHVGDTILGIKGRVGFEAAAPTILINAHQLLEKHTLSKWQMFQKESLSQLYGMLLHEGQYFDPVMRNIESFFESSQEFVNGEVFVKLSPYKFELEGISSKNDLMNRTFATYGEKNNNWSSEEVKGFIKIYGMSQKIFHQTNYNNEK